MQFPDFEPPQIVCPEDKSSTTDAGQSIAVVEWQNLVATDNSGDTPNVTCDALSESTFVIGERSVSCEAVDGSGNRAECSFQVRVTGSESLKNQNEHIYDNNFMLKCTLHSNYYSFKYRRNFGIFLNDPRGRGQQKSSTTSGGEHMQYSCRDWKRSQRGRLITEYR